MRRLHAFAAIALLLALSCGEKELQPTDETPPDTSLAWEGDDSVRPAFRAGSDYKGDRLEIDLQVEQLLGEVGEFEKKKAFAIMTPHAGFVFSGVVAAEAYARVEIPDVLILITVKHHGEGASPAFWNDGPFIIPGHALEIRHDLVERFIELAPEETPVDRAAFMESENHPLENQLPFITSLNPNAKIVPFAIQDDSVRDFTGWSVERINDWGKALAALVREIEDAGEDVLVITTTDLVHRIPLADAEVKDARLMRHIVDLEIQELHDYVVEESITIGGEIPVAVTMAAAIELGATGELVGLDTSFHRQQNPESVVGYGSAVYWPGE